MDAGGSEIRYGSEDAVVHLRLTYEKSGGIVPVAEPPLRDDVARELLDRLQALADGGEPVIWREVLFSAAPLEGFWRYRDEWQVRPVPADAPRPPQLVAPHPFILE